MTPQIHVGNTSGSWLSTVAPVGGIEVDVRWPLGGYQLDFNLLLGPRKRPPVVSEGASAGLFVGGLPTFAGQVSEVDWSEGKITAIGMARVAETIPALTADKLQTSSTPDVLVDTAISLGWNVTRPASLSSAAMASSDTTESLNMTAAMLDMWAGDNGKRWYVDAASAVRSGVDPTTPEIYVLPGAGELSWSTQKQADKIIGQYADAQRRNRIATVGTGTNVRAVDLTGRGPLTSTQANGILNQILAQSTTGGWVGGLTLAAGQITMPGGLHPSLGRVARMVSCGLMVRLLGHRDPRPGRFALVTDVVIGQAVWNVDDRTITLTPLGSVARDFAAIVESFGGQVAA
ncbi:MAG: hypothetical protein HOQ45_11940 [Nocardioidaceae bacterium]|nr:hypothetical protein [Nocardioidaceae bacterium]